MSATLTLMTAEELWQMPDDGYRYELIKGELRRMPPTGGEHGKISLSLGAMIAWHVRQHKLGVAFAAETGFLLATNPDTVRAPDASFVCQDRIPAGGIPKSYFPGAPDLAVEVVSPSDIYGEVEEKVLEWLDAGTRMVVVVNPRKRTVTVYRSQTDITILRETDVLSGGDVLPGFSCQIADLFS